MKKQEVYYPQSREEDEKAYVESYEYGRPYLAAIIIVVFLAFIAFVTGGTAIVTFIYYLITK